MNWDLNIKGKILPSKFEPPPPSFREENLPWIFRYLFNFSNFFVLLLPYRFEYDNLSCRYVYETSGLKRGIVLFVYIISMGNFTLTTIRFHAFVLESVQGIKIARLISMWFTVTFAWRVYVVFFTFWDRRNTFIETCGQLSKIIKSLTYIGVQISWRKIHLCSVIAIALVIFMMFVQLQMGILELVFEKQQPVTTSILEYVGFNLLRSYYGITPNSSEESVEFAVSYYPLSVFWVFVESYLQLSKVLIDLLVVAFCLLFQSLIASIAEHVESNNSQYNHAGQMLDLCLDILKLAELISHGIGHTFTANILVCLPYFALNLNTLYGTDWTAVFMFWIYILMYIGPLMLAADGNAKSRNLINFFQRESRRMCKNSDPGIQLSSSILLSQITNNAICLRGEPCFDLTYGLLGNIFSTVMTYAVIVLQLQ